MDRRTENRLIGALSAVMVAGLLVMAAGIAIGVTSGSSGSTESLAASSPTGTYNPEAAKQAIVDSMSAARASAIQFATDHPELLPPRHPGLMPTPTATLVPEPIGVTCTSDDLTAVDAGSNGATSMMLEYVEIVNSGLQACDLPALSSIEAFTNDGALATQSTVTSRNCSSGVPFCVSPVSLPLQPLPVPSPHRSFVSGSAGIILEHSSRCESEPTPVCMGAGPVVKIVFYFAGGLSVSAEMDPPRQLHGGGLGIWGLRLVGSS